MATKKQKLAVDKYSNLYKEYNGTFIYLIRCEEYYKIGVTFNLDNRLNTLQCGCPFELELIFAAKCVDANEVEELLHEKYKEKLHFREWFSLKKEDVSFIEKLVD